MTISAVSMTEVEPVNPLGIGSGIEHTANSANNSDTCFGKNDDLSPACCVACPVSIQPVTEHLHSNWPAEDRFWACHSGDMEDRSISQFRLALWEAGRRYVFMMLDGSAYPRSMLDSEMWTISDGPSWVSIVTQGSLDGIVDCVKSCRQEFWMVGDTRNLRMTNPLRICKLIVTRRPGLVLHRG